MIHIAESEWIIMKALWSESPLTSRQIIDTIDSDWNSKTIHTLISRLCKKGAVKAEKIDGTSFYHYSATISEQDCAQSETRSFIQRIYNGSFKNLVSTFAEDSSVTGDDIKELQELLEKLEKGD